MAKAQKSKSADLRGEFKEKGYVIIPGAITKTDIEMMYEELERVADHILQSKGVKPESIKGLNAKYLYIRDKFPGIKKNFYNAVKQLGALHTAMCKPEIVEMTREITGSPIFVDCVQFRIDDPSNDFSLPMHQEAYGCISYQAITGWVPMIDITDKTGGLQFVEGSHRNGFLKHGFVGNYHALDSNELQNVEVSIPNFKMGDLVLFDSRLFHGTNPMKAWDGIRWTAVARYNPVVDAPTLVDENAPLRTEKMNTLD